jgi:uncharacterized membrane protein YccC
MQREIFSHYFYSGFTVACGVITIGLGGALIGGASLAAGLAMGAICVSTTDVPTPARHKFFEILFSLLLGTLVTFAVDLSRGHAEWLFVAIAAASFVAAAITAYGKKAMPLSFALFFTLVLTLGQPAHTHSQIWQHSGLFALGGAIYLIYSVIIARFLDFRTRQQALGESLQALADYLRVQADFFDSKLPLDACYAALISQQAIVAERLQTARDLVFRQLRSRQDGMLASTLFAALELFEHLLSGHTDFTLLRERYAGTDLLLFFRDLSLKGGLDLQEIGIALMRNAAQRNTITYKAEIFAIEHELARLRREAEGRAEAILALAALVGVYDKTLSGLDQLERVRSASATPIPPEQALQGVDIEPFLSRPIYSARLLLGHMRWSSPILRYALRVTLAMSCGYCVDLILPYASHGYWILLTIAVIMRSSFSLTRQRHWDRVIGNLIGCLLAAFLLWATSHPALLVVAMFASVCIAHAYATINYRYTAVASCVMGLLAVRFLDPAAQFLVVERLLDTMVGGVIAYAFSFVLPSWEFTSIPRLVGDVLGAARNAAAASLQSNAEMPGYRLARKQLMDAIAALVSASGRMLAEPVARHRAVTRINDFITASYLMAAQLASVHILLQRRGAELEMSEAIRLMAQVTEQTGKYLDELAPADSPMAPAAIVAAAADSSARGILTTRLASIVDAAQQIGSLGREIRCAAWSGN